MSRTKRPMINDALKLLRLYIGLSQKQVAQELDLSQSMVSEIESGTKSVSIEILERYSTKFDVRMSQLMFFAEELEDQPAKTRGRLIVAPHILSLLERLAPKEILDGQ